MLIDDYKRLDHNTAHYKIKENIERCCKDIKENVKAIEAVGFDESPTDSDKVKGKLKSSNQAKRFVLQNPVVQSFRAFVTPFKKSLTKHKKTKIMDFY